VSPAMPHQGVLTGHFRLCLTTPAPSNFLPLEPPSRTRAIPPSRDAVPNPAPRLLTRTVSFLACSGLPMCPGAGVARVRDLLRCSNAGAENGWIGPYRP
jgi:hypothetical protein